MRHTLANLLYATGSRIDRLSHHGYEDAEFGDKRDSSRYGENGTTATTNVHLRDRTPVRGTFKPGDYTYAPIQIGEDGGATVTLFMTRATTRRLLKVVQHMDDLFCRHGEGSR